MASVGSTVHVLKWHENAGNRASLLKKETARRGANVIFLLSRQYAVICFNHGTREIEMCGESIH